MVHVRDTKHLSAKSSKSSKLRSQEVINVNLNVSYRTILICIIGLQATICLLIIFAITYLYSTPGSIYYNAHFIEEHRTSSARKRFFVPPDNDVNQKQNSTNINGTNFATSWANMSHIGHDKTKKQTKGVKLPARPHGHLGFKKEGRHRRLRNTTNSNVTDGTNNSLVMLTTTSKAFINITNNWLESQKRLGLSYNTTLICEDEETYAYYRPRVASQKFQVLYTGNYTMGGALKRPMSHYQQLIRRRTVYVRDTLLAGYDVLLVDVDTVWVSDPLTIIRDTYDEYDLWVAPGYDPAVPCPCFMYMKSIAPVRNLASQWVNRLTYKPEHRRLETDQNALEYILKRNTRHFRLKTLDKRQFPTGKEFFDPDWYIRNMKDVIVIHGNHLGREDNKTEKFKQFGLWFV